MNRTEHQGEPTERKRHRARNRSCRRRHPRHPWTQMVHVSWLRTGTPGSPVWVRCTNLSHGGVGMICRNMVHPGTRGIALMTRSDGSVLVRCFEIRHCRYVGNSCHSIGAEWIRMPANLPLRVECTENGPVLLVVGRQGLRQTEPRKDN